MLAGFMGKQDGYKKAERVNECCCPDSSDLEIEPLHLFSGKDDFSNLDKDQEMAKVPDRPEPHPDVRVDWCGGRLLANA